MAKNSVKASFDLMYGELRKRRDVRYPSSKMRAATIAQAASGFRRSGRASRVLEPLQVPSPVRFGPASGHRPTDRQRADRAYGRKLDLQIRKQTRDMWGDLVGFLPK